MCLLLVRKVKRFVLHSVKEATELFLVIFRIAPAAIQSGTFKEMLFLCSMATALSQPPTHTHTRHKYGIYKNVLLSDEELQAWESDCPVSREYIEKLSAYMASSGKTYKNYLATLRNWYRRDKEQGKVTVNRNASYDIDQAAKKAVEAVPTYERRKK